RRRPSCSAAASSSCPTSRPARPARSISGSPPPRRERRSPTPDGRTVGFISDRRHLVEEEPDAGDKKDREDGSQVHLLSLDGGEARRLTDLPRGVNDFEWSSDGLNRV